MSDSSPWPDLPPMLPWLLHDGEAAAQHDGVSAEGRARVWFTVRHEPAVRYDFLAEASEAGRPLLFSGANLELSTPDGISTHLITTDEGEKFSGWRSNEGANGFYMDGSADDLVGGDGSELDLLRVHLINFGEKKEWTPRLLDVGRWTIRIAPTGTTPVVNGFAVTHVLDLVRSDGSTFAVDDTLDTRRWLFDVLAFAAGRFVGLALPQGFLDGEAVYLEARCSKVDAWNIRRAWWDQRSLRDDDLAELCGRWVTATGNDDRMKGLLRRAAALYVSATAADGLDDVVPIAGVGIELMVWELIHQRDQLLSTNEFDRLSFASRLRLALRSVGIPAELPDGFTALKKHVEHAELPDGPYAFVDVRNRLVHPPKKQRGWPPPDVMFEAWFLGIEYLALLILASIEYEGKYRSQINYSGWPGSEEPVPWRRVEPEPAGAGDGAQGSGDAAGI